MPRTRGYSHPLHPPPIVLSPWTDAMLQAPCPCPCSTIFPVHWPAYGCQCLWLFKPRWGALVTRAGSAHMGRTGQKGRRAHTPPPQSPHAEAGTAPEHGIYTSCQAPQQDHTPAPSVITRLIMMRESITPHWGWLLAAFFSLSYPPPSGWTFLRLPPKETWGLFTSLSQRLILREPKLRNSRDFYSFYFCFT